jgi:putative sterol carrier protein
LQSSEKIEQLRAGSGHVDEALGEDEAIEAFFTQLEARGHEPLLERASGSIRFDITDGRAWLVDIDHGDVRVSRRRNSGDAVVHIDKAMLGKAVKGESNAMAALLRGAFTVEGDVGLLMNFQRMFPGPKG